MSEHRVVALALDGVVALDLAAPAHLFGHLGAPRYRFTLAAMRPGPVRSSSGFSVVAEAGLKALAAADTIVVPGYAATQRPPPGTALQALQTAARRGARVMSICTGAFALAYAGLLSGRRATTHWASTAELATRFPDIDVDADVLYVDEGPVLTSAGVAAGLDLCLHVVRRDHGVEVAAALARRSVIAPHREGGQAQFIERPLGAHDAANGDLGATRAWALEHLNEPLDVATMAAHALVSPRTFARRFRGETGTSPVRWLCHQRVLAAQAMLERDGASVEQIAAACGFGSAASLRAHFREHTMTTPTAYRRAFRSAGTSDRRPPPSAPRLVQVKGNSSS